MRFRFTIIAAAAAAIAGCGVGSTEMVAPTEAGFERVITRSSAVYSLEVPGNYTDARVRIKSPFNPNITDRYTYWAERLRDGTVIGKFEYSTTLASGPATVKGKMLCFTINGPQARLGGVVTHSTSSDIPKGTELTWSVKDLYAKRGDPDDTASPLLGAPANLYCAGGLPYPESPLLGHTYVYVEYVFGR
jgi:hypothetical protein